MQLRKYQNRTVQSVYRAWRGGDKRAVAVLPTGAGKTVTAAHIVQQTVAKGHTVVWLAHRTELLKQARDTIHALTGCSVGIVAAGIEPTPSAPIQIASIQTLLARGTQLPAKLLVVDECHHMAEGAPEWAKLLEQYKDSHWLGLTATPERGDGTGLAPLWGKLIKGAEYSELLTLGKLLPCRVLKPIASDTSALASHPADAYVQNAMGTQAVVFASTVSDAEKYAAEFCDRGIKAAVISGTTPKDERDKILSDFKSGRVQVLTNVYVLTEGWDAPNAQTCILARGCGSPGTFLQMVGRVMRPDPSDPSKTECLLIDLTGVSEIHGHPQADRVYSLEGQAIELKEKRERKSEKEQKEKQESERRKEETKAILERGLMEMTPLSLEAKAEWEKLQRVCKEREFSIAWAQKKFSAQFGSKPPARWVSEEARRLEFHKLQRDAREQGYKRGWAAYRFKSMFGEWPRGFGRR